MQLWDRIKNLWTEKSPTWTYLEIPSGRVDHPLPGSINGPGKGYVRLRLREMYLKHSRVGFRRMHPLLHSSVRMQYGGKQVELPKVAGPGQLEVLRVGNLENMLPLNYNLLPTTPYRGEDVEFLVTFFAAEYEDHLDRFLDFLGSVSSVANTGELALAVKLSSTLKDGLEKLLGLDALNLKLGLHDALSADRGTARPITPGYWLLAAEVKERIPVERLHVENHRLRIDNRGRTIQPINFDFLLISVETIPARDDWDQLPTTENAYKELKSIAVEGKREDLDQAYRSLAIKVLESDDLIEDDQLRILAAAQDTIKNITIILNAGLSPRSVLRQGTGSPSEAFLDSSLATDVKTVDTTQLRSMNKAGLLRPPGEG